MTGNSLQYSARTFLCSVYVESWHELALWVWGQVSWL